jgi:signal transduction histidine kinase
LSCTPLIEGDAYQGALAMVMDFTERKKLEEEMQRYLEQIKRSDRRKEEFLATLGHELRTPLATIALGLDTIESGDNLAEQARGMCARMQRQVGHLRRMVEDILQVSRLTLGKIKLSKRTCELNRVIGELEDTFRPNFQDRGVRLDVQLAGEDLPIFADDFRLTQMLGNILENAVKFTDPGGSVAMTVTKEADKAIVSVRDTGIGIPPERLSWIFEPFNQMKHGPERRNNGIGIGLALAQKIAELHEGHIDARSDGLGKGSEFVLHLPLETR